MTTPAMPVTGPQGLLDAYPFTCPECGHALMARPSLSMTDFGINRGHGSCRRCHTHFTLSINADNAGMTAVPLPAPVRPPTPPLPVTRAEDLLSRYPYTCPACGRQDACTPSALIRRLEGNRVMTTCEGCHASLTLYINAENTAMTAVRTPDGQE